MGQSVKKYLRRSAVTVGLVTLLLGILGGLPSVVFFERISAERNISNLASAINSVLRERILFGAARDSVLALGDELSRGSDINVLVVKSTGEMIAGLDRNAGQLVLDTCISPSKEGFCWVGIFGPLAKFQPVFYDDQKRHQWGWILVVRHKPFDLSIVALFGITLALAIFLAVVSIFIVAESAYRRVLRTFDYWERALADLPHQGNLVEAPFSELAGVNRRIFGLNELVILLQSKVAEAARNEVMIELSSQVAHDIRSPLAALTIAEQDFRQLPEATRIMVRSAVGRIRDIANSLLDRSDDRGSATSESNAAEASELTVELLPSLVESVLSEKRVLYRHRIGLEIEGQVEGSSYGFFGKIRVAEFKRIISNLINNSVEAICGSGRVTVHMRIGESGRVQVVISDTGKGISDEVLKKLGVKGGSHGKANGHGLGLYHAKREMEAWGGGLVVRSEPGKGTSVELEVVRADPPAWFVHEICLNNLSRVVVLDDDESVHLIWESRFKTIVVAGRSVVVTHCSTPDQLRRVVKEAKGLSDTLFLLDFELLGFSVTGLDLAAELGIEGKSILVTSRFEDKEIILRCEQLGMGLIPKGMAGLVPIRSGPIEEADQERDTQLLNKAVCDVVLIDDDELVQLIWKMAASKTGKVLAGFLSLDAFQAAANNIGRSTPIYIDSLLGVDGEGIQIRGELAAIGIRNMGFSEIFLATGKSDSLNERDYPWLSGIRGKEPPF